MLEVQTVESVTGVHIDHFVVSNIYGFDLIAQAARRHGGMHQAGPGAKEDFRPART